MGSEPGEHARPASGHGPDAHARPVRTRLALGASPRRLSFDRRLRLWLCGLVAPWVLGVGAFGWWWRGSLLDGLGAGALAGLVGAALVSVLQEQITRPLQTLSNVVAALREEDFSFRARGARRGDSLGDLALEVNSLASTLQAQRSAARDALTLAERVMAAMRTPVLAFTAEGQLRLLNAAAESGLGLSRKSALGQTAVDAGLSPLLLLEDGAIHTHPSVSSFAGETRWVLRRSSFRLGGVPHVLVVLSDVDAALREEERVAWQRLIRVLSHEINNSLTPITSVAGSLRMSLPGDTAEGVAALPGETLAGLRRGLTLIEERAFSLHRFLQAYQELTRLPRPVLRAVVLPELVARVAALERRLPVHVIAGPEIVVDGDAAQLEQLLINVVRNAAEAAMEAATERQRPSVSIRWAALGSEAVVLVEDNGNGLGESANLFVPFFTTKPGGSGIGLVLAQQIAQAHGGALSLVNRKEVMGCVAELRLLLRRDR